MTLYVVRTENNKKESKVISRHVLTSDNLHPWGDFIVLPHLETMQPHLGTMLPAHYLISHSVQLSWPWANQSFPIPSTAEHLPAKWEVYIWSHWFDLTRFRTRWFQFPDLSKHETLSTFGHFAWSTPKCRYCRFHYNIGRSLLESCITVSWS